MNADAKVNLRTATKLMTQGVALAGDSRRLFKAGYTEAGIATAEAARCLGTAARLIRERLGAPEPDAKS